MNTSVWGGTTFRCAAIVVSLVVACCLMPGGAMAQPAAAKVGGEKSKEGKVAEKPEVTKPPPAGPADEYARGVPRTAVQGFLDAVRDGDFARGAEYLDLRNLPRGLDKRDGPELARRLAVILDRALWIDPELVSNEPTGNVEDGLPTYRDSLGRIKTPERTMDMLLQRVPREDGVFIWMFSNRTVAEIPHLYEHFGYRPFEEALSRIFPDVVFLGWQAWQWAMLLAFLILAYLAALVPTWIIGLVLRRRDTEMSRQLARFFTGSIRVLLWLLLTRAGIQIIGPSTTMRGLLGAGTLTAIAFTWAAIMLVDLVADWLVVRFRRRGDEEATVVVQPGRTVAKILIILVATLVWLDNVGFSVATLLAGLGVGGIAVALAAQNTLRDFFGSVMILLDKPYQVGQRIVVKGHDGVVEDIGLRSTKIRLLTGHQATIPNEQMAIADIENIGRRPHIRRLTNITVPYNTPLEKVEKAVNIIRGILDNHEGMDPEFPPRIYFNDFNRDSLNIMMIYWYHPPAWWDFVAFNERVNLQIMREFEKEGIEFALPTSTTHLAQDDGQPLHLNIAQDSQVAGRAKEGDAVDQTE